MPAKPYPLRFWLQAAFLVSLGLILTLNIIQQYRELTAIARVKKVLPYHFPGMQFAGLENFFKGTDRIGYHTDRNLKDDEAGRIFAQAQLVLAPVVLELDNFKRRYIIFDCEDAQHAANKMLEIGARPIKKKGNLILAERVR